MSSGLLNAGELPQCSPIAEVGLSSVYASEVGRVDLKLDGLSGNVPDLLGFLSLPARTEHKHR